MEYLLYALSDLDALNIDFRLSVVGNANEHLGWRSLSRILNINEKISWVGKISMAEVNNLYKQADINVITSLMEGNPTVLWESMSKGVPTIVFDTWNV